MMDKAGRVHGLRSTLALVGLVALLSLGAVVRAQIAKQQEATRIQGLVGHLVSADPTQLSQIVKELDANPKVAATFLSPLIESTAKTIDDKRAQLHARLAMVQARLTETARKKFWRSPWWISPPGCEYQPKRA